MRSSWLVALALLTGCTSSVDLEARFFPLMKIVEVPEYPTEPGRGSTIYSTFVTPSVAAFDATYPPGSVYREAVLRHEQQHSIREFQDPLWFPKYVTEKSFRYAEEQVGYREEITYLRVHGAAFVPWNFAWSLANGYDGMVGITEAWAWVQAVCSEPLPQ